LSRQTAPSAAEDGPKTALAGDAAQPAVHRGGHRSRPPGRGPSAAARCGRRIGPVAKGRSLVRYATLCL